jgi:hypothetical protein
LERPIAAVGFERRPDRALQRVLRSVFTVPAV